MSHPNGPQFDVIADGGLDAYTELLNAVPVAPFSLNFGSESRLAADFSREEFFRRLKAGNPHPTTTEEPGDSPRPNRQFGGEPIGGLTTRKD